MEPVAAIRHEPMEASTRDYSRRLNATEIVEIVLITRHLHIGTQMKTTSPAGNHMMHGNKSASF